MTFSIAGRCGRSGMLGIAITSSDLAVGGRCAWVRAGVGAVVMQGVTLPDLGLRLLNELAGGRAARQALDVVLALPVPGQHWQVAVVDAVGRIASHSGAESLAVQGVVTGRGCVAAGAQLRNEDVCWAMTQVFEEQAADHLAERLLAALTAGLAAGGERGPVQSAALLVADQQSWPLVDLRVDLHAGDPVGQLQTLWLACRGRPD